MTGLDWLVLVASLVFIVAYGLWKGRGNRDLDGYILADRSLPWWTIALSVMATQASAITFISTPGQAYADGMRFVQFYFGLPIGMVILSITVIPIYHRLRVYTAYEYLEGRFDLKTRVLAAGLFLIQRGLAAGLTIFAPALILSLILGWHLQLTTVIIGALVVIYTALGGTKAVNYTNFHQLLIAMSGVIAACLFAIWKLPTGVGFSDAVHVAGELGRLNAIDFSFDWQNRYNFWSGVIGGMFLQLAYFGTDQSQVQRYLTGSSVTQSRIALLFNGMVKVPMQFFILFVGAMVFAFYTFTTPPVFFNPTEKAKVEASALAPEWRAAEQEYLAAGAERERAAMEYVRARNTSAEDRAAAYLKSANRDLIEARAGAISVMKASDEGADGNDTNFIFLTFVLQVLPAGLVGLVIAAVFAASMSSTASELNALASTTVVDFYRRMFRKETSDSHDVLVSKIATVFWGILAIMFAMYANRLGTLVEAVNEIGSLFYGTILGIFLVAFYLKRVGATATFVAALMAEGIVIWCRLATPVAWLWFNAIGCIAVIVLALLLQPLISRGAPGRERRI